jgi:hydrogenase/urease accessory protein HupE
MPHHFRFDRTSVASSAGLIFAGMLLLAGRLAALAHDPGLSTGQLRIRPGHLEVELTLAQADMQALMTLDADGDGKVSSSEWNSAQPSLNRLAGAALSVQVGGQTILASSTSLRRDGSNNVYLHASFVVPQAGELAFRSDLLSWLPRGHRQFITMLDATGKVLSETLLSATQPIVSVTKEPVSGHAPTFAGFLGLGLEHIASGYDHLLFLFALLLMAPSFRQAAGIITSFTVAHSITLGLATLDVIHFSPRLVEPLIAASIVYVGIENVVRRDSSRGRWLLTFGFGLVHGFGFAGVLREMGVSSSSTGITTPLLAFNLGVEAGQIAIAAAALPILWQIRKTPAFVHRVLPLCSSLVIVLGAWWFLERTVL